MTLYFFLLLAAFSIVFPAYQKHRGKAAWTRYYPPALLIVMAFPVFLMPGFIRPGIAVIMLVAGVTMMIRRYRSAPEPQQEAQQ